MSQKSILLRKTFTYQKYTLNIKTYFCFTENFEKSLGLLEVILKMWTLTRKQTEQTNRSGQPVPLCWDETAYKLIM